MAIRLKLKKAKYYNSLDLIWFDSSKQHSPDIETIVQIIILVLIEEPFVG